jgi:hypothetical protein
VHAQSGGGGSFDGCKPIKSTFKKSTDFVDTIISAETSHWNQLKKSRLVLELGKIKIRPRKLTKSRRLDPKI